MNKVQIGVLGLTLAAFGGAYFLFNVGGASQAPVVQQAKLDTVDVLVAAADIPMGTQITEKDYAWQQWPRAAASELMIARSGAQSNPDEFKAAITRAAFLRGEPIRRDKLVIGGNSGFMSAILPSGKRAVAIRIDASGTTSAGNFILPNDRVDVVRILKDDVQASGSGTPIPQVVLSNVKILAIGQTVQEENGKKVISGGNATLELTPEQAEKIIAASSAGGDLHLILRALVDSGGETTDGGGVGSVPAMTIVRFGSAVQAAR